ncbi:ATP-binding protein [Variovorax sp. NFACC27]|uniref:HAMP domain-containing sensor histidine kinase n=1 Tax=unclassified Variovorax TaxID=663243 RepID=UPI000897EB50|nr:Signal transduction histidine kinase [Variovorax sp. NFACC28]SEG98228.1 Signal transduction histidine kinase [Variovorax sp. NFACC29]SFE05760.1 Signal transduction histidine kinase [Variovorax sp. NFACC26]SFH13496.1 Signal transduction histidine kinase [Variovorax sp. NFACC27]
MAPRRRRDGPGRLFWKLLLAIVMCMVLAIGGTVGYMQLTGHAPPPPEGMAMWGPIPIVPFLSAVIAVLFISLVFAWYLSRPLRHLSWALDRFAEGRLDTRVEPLMSGRRDEIADLALDFDRMAVRIEQLAQANRALMHDISHELRSPLTRLQAAIGLLRQDPSQTAVMIERIERESERLDMLIEELLTLHRLDAGSAGAPRQRVDVIELLQAIADDAGFEAHASQRTLQLDAPGSFVIEAHGELLYRAFENVIRNALKFSPAGSEIGVEAVIDEGAEALVTTVRDRGPGVPPEMLQAIFEPFTRVEGSESVRGTGLGLAIARRSMLLHGGSVEATLREGGGLVVTLTLPARG